MLQDIEKFSLSNTGLMVVRIRKKVYKNRPGLF